MGRPLDLHGHAWGRWRVIGRVPQPEGKEGKGTFWLCVCTCGGTQVMEGGRITAGRGSSGCYKCRNHGATVGGQTAEYRSWRGMKERCLNPNHVGYAIYGGRGVKVCDRWLSGFDKFLEDMGPRPAGHSLDRIDPNGDYEPGNCRWANAKEQALNQRTPKLTDEQVAAILRLIEAGASQWDIAQALGIARGHVANIATGHSRALAA